VTPQPRGDLEDRELDRPGREAAPAGELIELGCDGHESVICCLQAEVIEVCDYGVWQCASAAPSLGVRDADQQLMQFGKRIIALGVDGAEATKPVVRYLIESRGRLRGRAIRGHRRVLHWWATMPSGSVIASFVAEAINGAE
jgi:hypothetical protein